MDAKPAIDLSTTLAGIRLKNPLVLASGIWGTSPGLLVRAARSGVSAVTAKTCTPSPRRGHKNPSVVDWGEGLINAMGLPNPGAEEETDLLQEAKERLTALGVALIASVSADTAEGFGGISAMVSRAAPDLIELNMSCPNVASECGAIFAGSPRSAAEATRAAKSATTIPCIVKLAPNVPSIAEIASAVVEAGADALTLVNSMPGMLIDTESGLPILANRSGGISGPALKPIALRCVYEAAEAVTVPIIGTGGVQNGTDAVEMLMAGASAVGIGSAVALRGEGTFALILSELSEWLSAHKYGGVGDVRGRAHRSAAWKHPSNPPPVPGWTVK
jgi:dihydroorotate dehydrogenase (NAD+) catalytic subunit